MYSTGIRDLDRLLGGGSRFGSVVLIEGGPNSAAEDFLLVSLPTLLNFLSLERGAIVTPPLEMPVSRVREVALRYLSSDLFDTRVRVTDYSTARTDEPWRVPMAKSGRTEMLRTMVGAEKAVRGPNHLPFLEVQGLDRLESMYGSERTVLMLASGIPRTKSSGNLGVLWVGSDSSAAAPAAGTADVHLAISRRSDGIELSGIRPAFPARRLEWKEQAGTAWVELGLP